MFGGKKRELHALAAAKTIKDTHAYLWWTQRRSRLSSFDPHGVSFGPAHARELVLLPGEHTHSHLRGIGLSASAGRRAQFAFQRFKERPRTTFEYKSNQRQTR